MTETADYHPQNEAGFTAKTSDADCLDPQLIEAMRLDCMCNTNSGEKKAALEENVPVRISAEPTMDELRHERMLTWHA